MGNDLRIKCIAALLFAFVLIPGISFGQACIDGTQSGQCVFSRTGKSSDKPWKCAAGILTQDSAQCGCAGSRTPWPDGTCSAYPHIKTFSLYLRYCSTDPVSSDYRAYCQSETTWAATHFDAVSTYTNLKPVLAAADSGIDIWTYRNPSALTDTEVATSFPNYCASHGCNPENGYLHLKEDTQRCSRFGGCLCVPGYSGLTPAGGACSTDPNDHQSRAATISQSRFQDFWKSTWVDPNWTDSGWLGYFSANAQSLMAGPPASSTLLMDIGNPSIVDLDKTIEFYGIPLNDSHPRIAQGFDVASTLRASLQTALGRQIRAAANAITPYDYSSVRYHPHYDSAKIDPFFEVWEVCEPERDSPSGGSPRSFNYDWDYSNSKNFLQESLSEPPNGRRYFLQGTNASSDKDRCKSYLYSYFLLFNNSHLSFMYYDSKTEATPGDQGSQSVQIQDFNWFPALEHDLGKPKKNPAGVIDIFGNANTAEHFEFATGADPSTPNSLTSGGTRQYHLLGRWYEKALVLTKFRTYGGLGSNLSATTHQLPVRAGGSNQYRELRPDGTLGLPINQITLRNMEGAILIPYDVVPPMQPTGLSVLIQ